MAVVIPFNDNLIYALKCCGLEWESPFAFSLLLTVWIVVHLIEILISPLTHNIGSYKQEQIRKVVGVRNAAQSVSENRHLARPQLQC